MGCRITSIFGAILLPLGTSTCASGDPDALPNDPMRVLKTKSTVPVPDAAMAEQSGASLEQLERGYAIFNSKCVECHEPRIAVKTDDPSWLPTMHGMGWNAGIEGSDEADLLNYLSAAAE